MRFRLLYILAVFCWIAYPVQFLFNLPVTPRQLMAVVMFLACCVEEKKPYWIDKYFSIYLIYILFYFISCVAEGFFEEGLRRMIGDFFVAYVAYWSTKIICIKYKSTHYLIYTLIAIGVFDAIITICQVAHITFFDDFLKTFQLIGYDKMNLLEDRELMGLAIPGIMSSPVTNGHILLLSSILSLYLCRDRFNVLGVVCFLVIIGGAFFAQLRSSFFLALLLSVFVVYKIVVSKRTTTKVVLLIALLLGVIYGGSYLYNIVTTGSNRYADMGMEANGRDVIYKVAFNYILENPIFGSYNAFVYHYGMYPHNFFLGAYLHAGIIGFIAVVTLAVKQQFLSIKICFSKKEKNTVLTVILASIIIGLFGNGITHNISLANGDVMTWLIWGALICNLKSDNIIFNDKMIK